MQDFQCIQQNQHLQQQQQQQDQTPSPIFGRDNNNDPSVGGELPTTNEENACLKVDANIFGDMHQAQVTWFGYTKKEMFRWQIV